MADQAVGAVPHPHRSAGLTVRTGDVDFDVSAVADGAHVAGSVFLPLAGSRPDGRTVVLVCLPGGTYTRAYWDLAVPGRAGYSFAEDMAARGHVVVALDNPGTGASSGPPDGGDVTIEMWGRAAAEVAGQVHDRVRTDHGDDLVVVGVGHSMGGYAVIAQQALGGNYDAGRDPGDVQPAHGRGVQHRGRRPAAGRSAPRARRPDGRLGARRLPPARPREPAGAVPPRGRPSRCPGGRRRAGDTGTPGGGDRHGRARGLS